MTVAPVIGEHDHQHSNIHCIICLEIVSPAVTTAGSLYADGNQAFACTVHFDDRAQWITAWALFETKKTSSSIAREIIV